ncbi:MAG: DMT family transporter [Granulosicoccus sp.]
MRKTTQACLLMLLSTFLLASMHALVRNIGQDLHPFVVVFFRNLFGLIAVVPLLIRFGWRTLRTNHSGIYIGRALIGLVAMLCWFTGLANVPIANATALSFSTTLFATLIAWLFVGEIVRGRRTLAILVGILGVFVVLRPGVEGFNAYSLLVVFSAFAWAASICIVKVLTRTDSVTCIVAWMGISLSLLSLGPALYYWQTPSASQWLTLILIGTLATGGHLTMTRAVKMADTSLVMSVDFARLIWASVLGAWFFGELLDLWTATGAVIIFLAGWYIVFRESRLQQPAKVYPTDA